MNDDIDDLFERWMQLPRDHPDATKPVHEYLGMTEREYERWMSTGEHPPRGWRAIWAAGVGQLHRIAALIRILLRGV